MIDALFERLKKSKFRSSFTIKGKELEYLRKKDFAAIREEAYVFINRRIRPSLPKNDGRQTPYKNHPVFIAQHATATCCRKCIAKWHKISENKVLNEAEMQYIVNIIMHWLKKYY